MRFFVSFLSNSTQKREIAAVLPTLFAARRPCPPLFPKSRQNRRRCGIPIRERGETVFFETFLTLLRELFYIPLSISSGSFPKPLSAEEEQDCFRRLTAGDRTARDTLISRNLRLVVHVVKKYYNAQSDQDDLISIGTIGLIKAVDTFSASKGTRFATYAARCIDNEVLMQFRSARKTRSTISLSDPLESDGGALTVLDVLCDDVDIAEQSELLQELERLRAVVYGRLRGRELRIIELRYGLTGLEPYTQQRVAELLGISRSYVSRLEKKALERLRADLRFREG